MTRVAHLTSVHGRYDVRVFHKQCKTLANAGYEVFLVVADGKGDQRIAGLDIRDVGVSSGGRLARMLWATRAVLKAALDLNADIYHIHDPELLPIVKALKRHGGAVVFDSHEDVPADILTKPYLWVLSRRLVSAAFTFYERKACGRLDYIVTATPAICRKFERMGYRARPVNNFPLTDEIDAFSDVEEKERASVCYSGAMTSIRGVPELVDAMSLTRSPARLSLAGSFTEPGVEVRCRNSAGWRNVDEHGFVSRQEVGEILGRAIAGVVTFLPAPNHVDAQPNKMFEYMAAGIPVIASNFPLWRELIEGGGCGVCVDPMSPAEIANAIDYLYENREIAREMGLRARAAVIERYNWEAEAGSLLSIYSELLAK